MSAERSLYRIAHSYLPTDVDAADAVQEALTRAWDKRGTLREPQYFRTWLTRIVINVCKVALRERRRVKPMAQVPEPRPLPPLYDNYSLLHDALQAMEVKYRIPCASVYSAMAAAM